MKKLTILMALFSFASEAVLAQQISTPQFRGDNGQSFSGYVFSQLDKAMDTLSAVCSKSVGTIQMIIDKKGSIQSVTITGDVPEILREQLKKIARASEGRWTLLGKKKNIQPVVMYFAIHISSGCEKLFNDVYYLNRKSYNFLKVLSGEGLSSFPMSCLLLEPLYFVRDYGYQDLNPVKK
jgi:hypothetical protein